MNKKSKLIKKVLKRLADERVMVINRENERLATLIHQLRYFDEMPECSQNLVIEETINDMGDCGWFDWQKEVKNELKHIELEEQ